MLERTTISVKECVILAENKVLGFSDYHFINAYKFRAPLYNDDSAEIGTARYSYSKETTSYSTAKKLYHLKLVEIAIHYAYTGIDKLCLANYMKLANPYALETKDGIAGLILDYAEW